MSYQAPSRLNSNDYITDPRVEDPENLPEPLGWNLLVRPYPINNQTRGGIFLNDSEIDYMNTVTNIGRVVLVGSCCWNKSEHGGEPWVEVGDFVSYPKHVGSLRKFKGVSYILLGDDEIVERLTDPLIFGEGPGTGYMQIDIPQEDLEKYNTIYNKKRKGK